MKDIQNNKGAFYSKATYYRIVLFSKAQKNNYLRNVKFLFLSIIILIFVGK